MQVWIVENDSALKFFSNSRFLILLILRRLQIFNSALHPTEDEPAMILHLEIPS